MSLRNHFFGLFCSAVLLFSCATASAGSHNWWIHEIFSNADGTVQFIELKECCGTSSEILLLGKWILSDTTTAQFVFPANLTPGTTADKHLLLATTGFAALPGAPTPDHIIVDNFFDLNADILTYLLYMPPTLTFGTGQLPTDGVTSLNQDLSTGVNSPTNFAGETGSVDASPNVPTLSQWGVAVMLLLMAAAGTVIFTVRRGRTTATHV